MNCLLIFLVDCKLSLGTYFPIGLVSNALYLDYAEIR